MKKSPKRVAKVVEALRSEIDRQLTPFIPAAPFALLDFPNYANVGDGAIWAGQAAFFRQRHRTAPTIIGTIALHQWNYLDRFSGPILISGGGNFGDLYPAHQHFREALLERYPDRPIIQLPQSIHFKDRAARERTARAIKQHRHFTLFVRDRASLVVAEQFDCETRLCPDMAFCLGPIARPTPPTAPLVALLRTDKESALGHTSARDALGVDWVVEPRWLDRASRWFGKLERCTPRPPPKPLARWLAQRRLARGCRLLSAGSVVISDRLHAHILCVLMGVPHVMIDNSYGKVSGHISAWTGASSSLLGQASTLDEAVRIVSNARFS